MENSDQDEKSASDIHVEMEIEKFRPIQELAKLNPINPAQFEECLKKLDRLCDFTDKIYFENLLTLFLGNPIHDVAIDKIKEIKPPVTLCGKSLDHADIFWMCDTCSKIGNCTCYCCECFEKEKHKGHAYSFQLGNVGCCDCGDENSLVAETFCKKHAKNASAGSDLNLLSEYQKTYVPILLKHLMERFNERLNIGKLEPPPNCIISDMDRVLYFLDQIFRISPLYHSLIADCLLLQFKLPTTHCCTSLDKPSNDTHECKCNVLENIMKYIEHCSLNTGMSAFFAELCKVKHDFGLKFLGAFWSNYLAISQLADKRNRNFDFTDKIMWQVIIVDKEVTEICPKYIETYLLVVENAVDSLIENEKILIFDASHNVVYQRFYNMYYDFEYFFNKDGLLSEYLLTKTDLFERYMKCFAKLQYIGHAKQLKEHAPYEDVKISLQVIKSIYLLTEPLMTVLRWYNFGDEKQNKRIFKILFDLIKLDYENSENKTLVNTANIPLFRIFSLLVNKFIYLKYRNSTESEINKIKQKLCEYSDLPYSEFDKICEYMLNRVLRVMGFICEIMADCWMYYSPSSDNLMKYSTDLKKECILYFDITLIQILLQFVDYKTKNIFTVFEQGFMVPIIDPSKTPLPHLKYAPDVIVEFGILPENQMNEINEKVAVEAVLNNLEEKSQRLSAIALYMMGACLFNDSARISTFLKSSMKGFRMNTPPEYKPEVEYILKKESTNVVLLSEEKGRAFEMFNLDKMSDILPGFLKVNESTEILKSYFQQTKAVKGHSGYKVGNDFHKYVNLFNMGNEKFLTNAEMNLKEILKLTNSENCDIFENSCIMEYLKSLKNYIITRSSINCAENLIKTMETFNNSKEYIGQLSIILILYEFTNLQNIKEWKIEEKQKMIKLLDLMITKLDKMYQPSIIHISEILTGKSLEKSIKPLLQKAENNEILPSSLKEKQKKIAEEFKNRQAAFKKKFSDDLNKLEKNEISNNEDTCSYCKEPLIFAEFKEKPYGFLIQITPCGVYKKSKEMTLKDIFDNNPSLVTLQTILAPEGTSSVLNTCGHLMHYTCYKDYIKSLKLQIKSCPLCKSPFNNFLPALQKPLSAVSSLCSSTIFNMEFDKTRYNSLAHYALDQVIRLFIETCKSADFGLLYNVIISKQKYYKNLLNCLLSIIQSYMETPEKSASIFQTNDRIKYMENDILKLFLHEIISAKLEHETSTNSTEFTIHPLKYIEIIEYYIYKVILKYLFFEFCGSLGFSYINSEDFYKDALQICNIKESEINNSLVSFLGKLVFIQSILIDKDYSNPSMDKQRNIINSDYSIPDKIKQFTGLLGIPCDIFTGVKNQLQDIISHKSTKSAEIYEFIKTKFKTESNKYIESKDFYLQTTPTIFKMIKLPDSYDEILSEFYTKNCKNCNEKCKTKCLCLYCGEVLCAACNCCRKQVIVNGIKKVNGELTLHSIKCGYGTGIFLLMYQGTLILQSDSIGIETTSIYTNSFGEDISNFCALANLPYNSHDLSKYKLNMERYNYLKEILELGKEKYEIWKEKQNGKPIIPETV